MIKVQCKALLRSDYGKNSATCNMVLFSSRDAIKYAAILSAIIWSLTIASHAIEPIRMISIPVGVALGLYCGIRVYRKWCGRIRIEAGHATCPKCARLVTFAFDDVAAGKLEGICHKCACCYELVLPLAA